MITRFFLPGLAFCVLGLTTFAEPSSATSDIPTPTPPFVSDPASGTKWNITLKYQGGNGKTTAGGTSPEANPQNQQHPATIECQRGLSGTRITLRDAQGGAIKEGFLVGNWMLRMNPRGTVSILPSDEKNFASPFFVRGYQGTEWVSMQYYQGVEKIGKDACYKYAKPARMVTDPSEGFSHPEVKAWIQVDTKIPLLISIGDIAYSYSPIESAGPDIDMPPEIRKTAERLKLEQRALEQMRRK
jgi:hypothetical protein